MNQADLFDRKTATAHKDAGIETVREHNSDFIAMMQATARNISQAVGSVTSDDLRRAAQNYGIEPRHQNAWGAIFRGKEWMAIGYTKSTLVSNHARTIRVWKHVDS